MAIGKCSSSVMRMQEQPGLLSNTVRGSGHNTQVHKLRVQARTGIRSERAQPTLLQKHPRSMIRKHDIRTFGPCISKNPLRFTEKRTRNSKHAFQKFANVFHRNWRAKRAGVLDVHLSSGARSAPELHCASGSRGLDSSPPINQSLLKRRETCIQRTPIQSINYQSVKDAACLMQLMRKSSPRAFGRCSIRTQTLNV